MLDYYSPSSNSSPELFQRISSSTFAYIQDANRIQIYYYCFVKCPFFTKNSSIRIFSTPSRDDSSYFPERYFRCISFAKFQLTPKRLAASFRVMILRRSITYYHSKFRKPHNYSINLFEPNNHKFLSLNRMFVQFKPKVKITT